jgi:hypothetical protein
VVVVPFAMVFDRRAEGVLEDLGQYVLHVDWDIAVLDESNWFGCP